MFLIQNHNGQFLVKHPTVYPHHYLSRLIIATLPISLLQSFSAINKFDIGYSENTGDVTSTWDFPTVFQPILMVLIHLAPLVVVSIYIDLSIPVECQACSYPWSFAWVS